MTQRRMFFKRRARGGCPSCAARQRPWAAGQGGSPSPASSFPEAAWLRACDKAPCSEVGGASGKALAQWREAARNSHLFPGPGSGFSPHPLSPVSLAAAPGTVG